MDILFDENKKRATIEGFSFAPAENLDYNEAFNALFFNEVGDLVAI